MFFLMHEFNLITMNYIEWCQGRQGYPWETRWCIASDIIVFNHQNRVLSMYKCNSHLFVNWNKQHCIRDGHINFLNSIVQIWSQSYSFLIGVSVSFPIICFCWRSRLGLIGQCICRQYIWHHITHTIKNLILSVIYVNQISCI